MDMVHAEQKAKFWERRKSGQCGSDAVRVLEERERCLRSWL